MGGGLDGFKGGGSSSNAVNEIYGGGIAVA